MYCVIICLYCNNSFVSIFACNIAVPHLCIVASQTKNNPNHPIQFNWQDGGKSDGFQFNSIQSARWRQIRQYPIQFNINVSLNFIVVVNVLCDYLFVLQQLILFYFCLQYCSSTFMGCGITNKKQSKQSASASNQIQNKIHSLLWKGYAQQHKCLNSLKFPQ